MCRALVSPLILEKFWFLPFFPLPIIENLIPPLHPKFSNIFCTLNLKNYSLSVKNTTIIHTSNMLVCEGNTTFGCLNHILLMKIQVIDKTLQWHITFYWRNSITWRNCSMYVPFKHGVHIKDSKGTCCLLPQSNL